MLDRDELLEEAVGFAEDLVEDGLDEGKAKRRAAEFLDAIIPLDKLIPGPLGKLAEKHDDDAFEWALDQIDKLFRVDPVKKAARQAKRAKNKADKQAKRDAKRAERRS